VKIEDGGGSGRIAEVNLEQRLNVSAQSNSRSFYISRDFGEAYTWTSSYSAGTGEEVLYVKNDSTTHQLVIDLVHVGGVLTGLFEIYQVSGTAAGTSLTGVNLNLTSSNTASATALGNASVTGLTIGNRLYLHRTPATTSGAFELADTLILGTTDAIAITYTGGTGIVDAEIRGFFEVPPK
jgi:hypothetical protein